MTTLREIHATHTLALEAVEVRRYAITTDLVVENWLDSEVQETTESVVVCVPCSLVVGGVSDITDEVVFYDEDEM